MGKWKIIGSLVISVALLGVILSKVVHFLVLAGIAAYVLNKYLDDGDDDK